MFVFLIAAAAMLWAKTRGVSATPTPTEKGGFAGSVATTVRCAAYAALFHKLGKDSPIPAEYWAALAQRESGCNEKSNDGPAWGLFQVVESVRSSWNEKFPQRQYSRQDLLRPEVSAELALFTWRNILEVLTEAGEPPDWDSRRWVELATAAWNSGYSRKRGMGRAIRWLREKGLPVNVDTVVKHAREIGLVFVQGGRERNGWWLLPQRLKWWRSVADLYLKRRGMG